MAKIKLGAFITEIAGKVGGTVFSRNKGGAYAKNRVMPSNPRTSTQQNIRGFFGTLAQQWRALTQVQREGWTELAAGFNLNNSLGDAIKLSGIALFQKLNGNLRSLKTGPILNAPALGGTDAITLNDFTMTNTVGVLTNTFQAVALSTSVPDTKFAVFATAPYSPGISNVNNRFRLIDNFDNLSSINTANTIAGSYTPKFGVPPVGMKVSVRILPINSVSGENGVPLEISCTVEEP